MRQEGHWIAPHTADFSDLGLSATDRAREAGDLFADASAVVLASHQPVGRAGESAMHRAATLPFLEIYVQCPLEVAERQAPNGRYAKARAGELPGFTGIEAPYEIPETPDLVLATREMMSVADQVEATVAELT